ncbi:hypothetical protein EG329_004264 [Mollisiaceae sp. DMI_Dod_QoI]|nr:hypothetical protein EG329_004264 [Helotiales sp. DMI_Dod_QoI]
MSDEQESLDSLAHMFQRSEKLLEFFCEFHEDFDVLRSAFAPRPHSSRRPLFNKISGKDDVDIIVLRDKIVCLVDSFRGIEVGTDRAEQQPFKEMMVQIEHMIKQTGELRKKLESQSGYNYDVGTPQFNVIGNHPQSTRDRSPNSKPRTSSRVGAGSGKIAPRSTVTTNESSKSNQIPTLRAPKRPLLSVVYKDESIKAALNTEMELNSKLAADIETVKQDKQQIEQELYDEQDKNGRLERELERLKAKLASRNGNEPGLAPPPPPHILKDTMTSRKRLQHSNSGILPDDGSLDNAHSTIPSSPPLPVHPSKLTAVPGSATMFSDAHQKAREFLSETEVPQRMASESRSVAKSKDTANPYNTNGDDFGVTQSDDI